MSLYGFVVNTPMDDIDVLGHSSLSSISSATSGGWSITPSPVPSNPELLTDGVPSYILKIVTAYSGSVPSGSTEEWLLTRINYGAIVVSPTTGRCISGFLPTIIRRDVTPTGGPSLDTAVFSGWSVLEACAYVEFVKKTIGFNSPSVTLYTGSDDLDLDFTIDAVEYASNLANIQESSDFYINYVYVNTKSEKCRCCLRGLLPPWLSIWPIPIPSAVVEAISLNSVSTSWSKVKVY